MYVVTGGGSGIGKALAHALALREKAVLIVGRNEKNLIETAKFSPNIRYFRADLTQETERKCLVKHLSSMGSLQALVHNAALIEPITPLAKVDRSAWQACLETNVNVPLFLTQALIPVLSNARVLHIGSGAAYFPIEGWGAYCVSKAALAMLTRCLQLESKTIAFASVMPGIIDTDMQRKIRDSANMSAEKHHFFMDLKATHRLLTPETVALFLCWLLLDITSEKLMSQEWDIYDKSHHADWLIEPHVVPETE